MLPTDSHRQVPSNAVYEGIRCVENLLNQHGGMLSFVSLRHMLYRIDYSFFGNLFDTFGGLQNFLCFFPNHFSVITVGDKVFVQLNQRKTGSQSPSLSNSDSIDTRDSNDIILSVLYYSCVLLQQSPTRSLKSVELANNIRDNLGSNVLQIIRNRFSGLLYLYEQYPELFSVSRIPKNDQVFLVCEKMPEFPERVKIFNLQKHSRCLHVGNLGPRLNEEDLRKEFNMYGDVREVRIVTQGDRRYGFIYFSSVNGAERARAKLIEKPQWKGNIAFAKKKRPTHPQPKWNSRDFNPL